MKEFDLQLSFHDSLQLKGYAIICIVLHNFTHWLPQAVKENEYDFDPERIFQLFDTLHRGIAFFILNVFSYFGHYGVAVFLFISGYGLVRKYEGRGKYIPSPFRFVLIHARKLWWIMIPALLTFVASQNLFRDGFQYNWKVVLNLLSFTSNLLPQHNVILGPWWFFSLMLQFYILYRFLFYKFQSLWILLFSTLLGLALQTITYHYDLSFCYNQSSYITLEYLRYNFIAWLLPFVFGIIAARYHIRIKLATRWIAIIASILLLASCIEFHLWLFSPIFAIFLFRIILCTKYHNVTRRVSYFLGTISAYLFALHPIVRHYLILPASKALQHQDFYFVFAFICGFLFISIILAYLFYKFLARLQKIIY